MIVQLSYLFEVAPYHFSNTNTCNIIAIMMISNNKLALTLPSIVKYLRSCSQVRFPYEKYRDVYQP